MIAALWNLYTTCICLLTRKLHIRPCSVLTVRKCAFAPKLVISVGYRMVLLSLHISKDFGPHLLNTTLWEDRYSWTCWRQPALDYWISREPKASLNLTIFWKLPTLIIIIINKIKWTYLVVWVATHTASKIFMLHQLQPFCLLTLCTDT